MFHYTAFYSFYMMYLGFLYFFMLLFVRDSDDIEELEESSGYTFVVMLWEPYNHSDKYFFQVKSNSNSHLSRKPWFTQISQCDGGASMIFSVGAGGYLNPQWVTQGQMQCFVYSSVASCVTVAFEHNNKQQSLHSSGCSCADTPGPRRCFWKLWSDSWQMLNNI